MKFFEQLSTGLALGGLLSLNIMLVPPVYTDTIQKYRYSQVLEVWTDVKKAVGQEVLGIPIYITDEKHINAYYDTIGHKAYITIGMLEFIDYDKDIIAFVLGHELAHGYLRHDVLSLFSSDWRHAEKMADIFGQALVFRAGYDACKGHVLWDKLLHKYGDYLFTKSHPSEAQRAYYMRCK